MRRPHRSTRPRESLIVKAIADLGIEAPTVKDTGKIVKQIDNPSVGGKDVSAYIKAL